MAAQNVKARVITLWGKSFSQHEENHHQSYFVLIVVLAVMATLLCTAWIGDDAFITLRVIDNFVNGYGLRFNVIERVQVFTHPLWMWFLVPFYALTREAMVTTMLVSVLLSSGALWLLATKIAKHIEYGCLPVLAAATSRAICQFSTSGLETPLTFLLLTLLVWQLYQTEKTWIPAGIAGLLFLNRLDNAILVAPVVTYIFFHDRRGNRVKVALAAMFPAVAWMIFSIIYYGAPFPNTAYAKLGTGFSTGELILRGLEYTKDFMLTDPLLALIIILAVFIALRSRDRMTKLLGIGIALYVIYTIVIGGDFMSCRFFAAPGFLALCLLAKNTYPQWLKKRIMLVGVIAIGVVGVLLVARIEEQPINIIPKNGIADERRFYYARSGLLPILKIWWETGLKPAPGMRLGLYAQRTGGPVVAGHFIGMMGYYGGPAVHIVDEFALSDAFLARLPAIPGARVGHYERLLPSGYVSSTLNESPVTNIEELRPLLNDITLATRAPLFAEGRWDAIWRLISGHYNWVYKRTFTR